MLSEPKSRRLLRTVVGLNPCFNGRCSRREYVFDEAAENRIVLILVLMEDALGVMSTSFNHDGDEVLILVLMEDALGDLYSQMVKQAEEGLNPCFNGRCSRSRMHSPNGCQNLCLNPCFNGRCSRSGLMTDGTYTQAQGLNPCFNGRCSRRIFLLWARKVLQES